MTNAMICPAEDFLDFIRSSVCETDRDQKWRQIRDAGHRLWLCGRLNRPEIEGQCACPPQVSDPDALPDEEGRWSAIRTATRVRRMIVSEVLMKKSIFFYLSTRYKT
jgi:hypothetical protein